jgi:hypothetical protein
VTNRDLNRNRVGTAALTLAIFAAPFLAFLYGLVPALVVMAFGLAAATYLLRSAVADTQIATRLWLRAALLINIVLALACLVAAIWLIVRPW